ncbi:MAG: chorismate-binding protein [Chlamydiia bacterium]|nr:chorismate-binding protein [Chlamydiia bacterium]
MKVFWSRECPKEAIFHGRTFRHQLRFFGPAEQILHLPKPAVEKAIKRIFWPDKKAWIEKVQRILREIEEGRVEKVVLARCVRLEFAQPPDPLAMTAHLQQKSRGATLFCFAGETQSFLGATPERLFVRRGRHLTCDAMAGTRWGNRAFGEKEMREVLPVQRFFQEKLGPICEEPLIFSPISVHATQTVEHLYSVCHATLQTSVSDDALLQELHPTPALCGVPREKAIALIHELEPFDRGAYGGVVGWKCGDASEYVVAIRSCLLEDYFAHLYSAAGIVKGSDPEAEWEELDQKLKIYEELFP